MTMQDTDECIIDAAMDAARHWLAGYGADPDAAVIITVAPSTRVGLWQPGRTNVGMLPGVDVAGLALCAQCAPLASRAMEMMPADAREAAAEAIVRGARLQLVVAPSTREATLGVVQGEHRWVLAELATATATLH